MHIDAHTHSLLPTLGNGRENGSRENLLPITRSPFPFSFFFNAQRDVHIGERWGREWEKHPSVGHGHAVILFLPVFHPVRILATHAHLLDMFFKPWGLQLDPRGSSHMVFCCFCAVLHHYTTSWTSTYDLSLESGVTQWTPARCILVGPYLMATFCKQGYERL